jgi:hypothetical protein
MIIRYIKNWELKIENWEFERNDFEIKKRAPDNRILNNKAYSKQRNIKVNEM